jgi:hypothetical protein
MRRRTLLGVCIGLSSSGCLGFTGPPEKTIPWLRLVNERDESYSLDVSITRDDEAVFSETYQLGPPSEQGSVQIDDPVENAGRYSVYIDAAHLHPSEFAQHDLSEPFVGIEYTLHEDGTTGFDFEPIQEC